MQNLKQTQTVETILSPPFGDKFQIAAILPLSKPIPNTNNKIPISLHLSKVGTNTCLGCYVYTILDSNNGKTYQTLLNNSEETLVDITKKFGNLISKKFFVPTYVSVSGQWSIEDLLTTVQLTIKFIEESF
jgi:hypothetical protein